MNNENTENLSKYNGVTFNEKNCRLQTAYLKVLALCGKTEREISWLCLHKVADLRRVATVTLADFRKAEAEKKADKDKKPVKKAKVLTEAELAEKKRKEAEKQAKAIKKAEAEKKEAAKKAEEDAFLAGEFVTIEENAPEMSEDLEMTDDILPF